MTRAAWLRLGWLQTAALVFLCLIPLTSLPGEDIPFSDKLYHALAYTQLMWWFAVALPRRAWWRVGLSLAMLGIGIEIAQAYVPFRGPSVADAVADGLGVLLGAAAARITPFRLPCWIAAE